MISEEANEVTVIPPDTRGGVLSPDEAREKRQDFVRQLYPQVVLDEFPDLDVETYDFTKCETRNNDKGPYHKIDVIAAIVKTCGVMSEMSTLLGRSRARVKDYVCANVDVKDIYDEVRDSAMDMIERNVMVSALMGDGQAQRFVLQTIGKGRGYTTRAEHTGKDEGPIEHVVKPVDELLEKLDQIAARKVKEE